MQVSCKVSYSVLVYVERQGAQLDRFFEKCETPIEFLKNPTGWLDVSEMEAFLGSLAEFINQQNPEAFYREIGVRNFELRAWGVLDSVLKMVESPKDIFLQPDRFLSYFLTPHPELVIDRQEDRKLIFTFNGEATAKNVLAYLIGAVEGLPNYMGTPPAQITQLSPLSYQLQWFDDQESLFDEQEKKRRQFHPEIVHSVMQSLQEHQKTIGDQSETTASPQHIASEAFEKMVSLEVEKRLDTWINKQKDFDESFFKIKNDFYKMYDYFTRAQQIITLISPSARKASVREAMRRVDWEHIQKEFPKMVESACDSILAMKDTFQMTVDQNTSEKMTMAAVEPVNLNELIDSVVESLSFDERSFTIDRNMHLDKPVAVDPASFASAIGGVFNNSLSKSNKGAEVRVVTRSSGSKVQIEITDAGVGIPAEELQHIFDADTENNLSESQKIIQRHRGQISISSRQGEGSTYLIELPV